MRKEAIVKMTRSALRKFLRNSHRGYGFVFRIGFLREVEAYISAHEAAGISFDNLSQYIRYDDRLILTLRNIHGFWYITEMYLESLPITGFKPSFTWKRVKIGAFEVAASVLTGWQYISTRFLPLTTSTIYCSN